MPCIPNVLHVVIYHLYGMAGAVCVHLPIPPFIHPSTCPHLFAHLPVSPSVCLYESVCSDAPETGYQPQVSLFRSHLS